MFIAAIVSSVAAANEGKQYKAAKAAYSLYLQDTNPITGAVSAKADSAQKQSEEHREKLIKFFAVSLLLYFALIVMLALLYMTGTKSQKQTNQKRIKSCYKAKLPNFCSGVFSMLYLIRLMREVSEVLQEFRRGSRKFC